MLQEKPRTDRLTSRSPKYGTTLPLNAEAYSALKKFYQTLELLNWNDVTFVAELLPNFRPFLELLKRRRLLLSPPVHPVAEC